MNLSERIRQQIMEMVRRAENQRVKLHKVKREIANSLGVSRSTIDEVLKDLVRRKKLVHTCRHCQNYIEIPAQDVHVAARPMKVLFDAQGESWICDSDVDPSKDLASQGCWRYGDMPFTRED